MANKSRLYFITDADSSGGLLPTIVVTTTPFAISPLLPEQYIAVDIGAIGGPSQLNLPPANATRHIHVKARGLANANPITMHPDGTDTIDGLNADRPLLTDWGGWEFVSDGSGHWDMFVR